MCGVVSITEKSNFAFGEGDGGLNSRVLFHEQYSHIPFFIVMYICCCALLYHSKKQAPLCSPPSHCL